MKETIINSFTIWTDAQGLKAKGRVKRVENISLEGIAKLRELILDLAVSGKLVPQNLNDEPAFELLKKIELEKQLLIKEKKLSVQKKQLPISEEEKTFKLSQSWEWVRLTDIGIVFNGNSIDAATKESKYTNNKGIPYIATKDVGYGWENLDYDNGISIPEDEINFRMAHKGSVLICAEGGSAGKKCGITNRDIYFGNKLFAIELFGNIPSTYILSNYLSSIFTRQFQSNLTGIIGGISIQKFNDIIIPFPPLSEQHRIVAKVIELMTMCDKLEVQQFNNLKTHQTLVKTLLETLTQAADADELQASWERISKHFDTLFCTEDSIDQLKQTILQLAVMGKLVKQDSSDEPASELLKKLSKEKEKLVEAGKIKKQAPLPEIEEVEILFDLPVGWVWARLQETTTLITDGKHGDCQNQQNSGYYFLSAKDIIDGNLDYEFAREINYEEFQETHRRTDLSPGDICMVNTGATVGKLAIASDDPKTQRTTFQKSVAVIKPLKGFLFNEYLKMFLISDTKNMLIKSGGSAINNLLLGDLKKKVFPLPPLLEQHRIVTKVDELLALCDGIKENILKSQDLQVLLAKTIVEKAVS